MVGASGSGLFLARTVLFVVVAVACFPSLECSPNVKLQTGLKQMFPDFTNLTDKLQQAKQLATSLFRSNPFSENGPLYPLISSATPVRRSTNWPHETVTFNHPLQSPVDLISSKAITMSLPVLKIIESHLDGVKAKLYNSGHTAYLYIEEDVNLRPYLVGGPLKEKFIFEQMHFHWGGEDIWGSEHFIDGESFAVEMHMVHFNSKYLNFTEASTKKDGLAVLTVFAEAHATDNVLLEPLHSLLSNISEANSAAYLDSSKAMQWAGSALSTNNEYYTYPGSLTTPPYSENVVFILLPKPISLSTKQLSSFRALHSHEHGQIIDNKRQVQPLHNRPIVKSVLVQ